MGQSEKKKNVFQNVILHFGLIKGNARSNLGSERTLHVLATRNLGSERTPNVLATSYSTVSYNHILMTMDLHGQTLY